MPQYLYKCKQNHLLTLAHSISECDQIVTCPRDGTTMHRVPLAVAVNWNGLPPHLEGTRSPAVQEFINNAPERQAQYLDTKESKHA
jgi:predicted nucleic acid-binding Zn ribbon protein